MKRPAFFVLINFFLVNTLLAFLPYGLGDISYNIGRIAIIFYAGWLVRKTSLGGIRHAAFGGMFVYFIDHVALKGGVFLLNYLFKPAGLGLAAFGGVLVSFVIFLPLAMLVGAAGGYFARHGKEQTDVDPD